MFIDAIRREKWLWAVFIFISFGSAAVQYFFCVYRADRLATRGFELPGVHDRKGIKELQSQIHHLDKAHHHSQLGDLYFQPGKLAASRGKPLISASTGATGQALPR